MVASQWVMTPHDAEIYRKYSDDLIRFASGLVGPSGAEDVVANAVLRAISSAQWKAVDNQRAYLYRSVLNEAHSQHRSTQRRLAREIKAQQRHDTSDQPVSTRLRGLFKAHVGKGLDHAPSDQSQPRSSRKKREGRTPPVRWRLRSGGWWRFCSNSTGGLPAYLDFG